MPKALIKENFTNLVDGLPPKVQNLLTKKEP
jgi:hypothetical protein